MIWWYEKVQEHQTSGNEAVDGRLHIITTLTTDRQIEEKQFSTHL